MSKALSKVDASTRQLLGTYGRPVVIGGTSAFAFSLLAPMANDRFGWALPTDWYVSLGVGAVVALSVEAFLYAVRDEGVYQGKMLTDAAKEYKQIEKDLDDDQRRALNKALTKAGVNANAFAHAIAAVNEDNHAAA